jgi:hypothetical protein
MSAISIIREVAASDELAFDLFFHVLDLSLAAHPEILLRPLDRGVSSSESPLPVSGFVHVLTERPLMFLPSLSVGCLRAFLDGYRLAAMEERHLECLDLEGFEHWVRQQLDLKGFFRWETAALSRFKGAEVKAFNWAVNELKSFAASRELPKRVYEIRVIGEGTNSLQDD